MPYTVYTLFNDKDELLYVGRAMMWGRRMAHGHAYTAPWYGEVRSARLLHVETDEDARALEWKLITGHRPRYNSNQRTPCIKCGGPKISGRSRLCPACQDRARAYRPGRGRYPRPQTGTCPRCKGPKPSGPSYCPPCKRLVSKEARARKKAASIPGV